MTNNQSWAYILGAANPKIIQRHKLQLNAAIQVDLSTLLEKEFTSSLLLIGNELNPAWVKDQKQNNMVDDYLVLKGQRTHPQKTEERSEKEKKDKDPIKQHKPKYKD